MRALLKRLARTIPPVRKLLDERDAMARELASWNKRFSFPPGHYYSPMPALEEVAQAFSRDQHQAHSNLPGVDLNLSTQLQYWSIIKDLYQTQPFAEISDGTNRYGLNNQAYCYADAIVLQTFLRHFRPRQIVEIGSGYSSAVMLDINDRFLDGSMALTFIDPYPERLKSLLREADHARVEIVPERLQDMSSRPWQSLRENDILFIDSSHVCKCGSDVNQIYFEIVPTLAPGVLVHVHDIFPGFEYPRKWVESWGWNEAYLLRAFLQFNKNFEILFWTPWMVEQRMDECRREMPFLAKNTGASIWLRKTS